MLGVLLHVMLHVSDPCIMFHLMLHVLFHVVFPSSCHVRIMCFASCFWLHVSCFLSSFMFHVSFLMSCCCVSCLMSCFALQIMCLSCPVVDVKHVTASTSVDTIGMRSQNNEGRHEPRQHESCFWCHEGFVACLISCIVSCWMSCFMLHIISQTCNRIDKC